MFGIIEISPLISVKIAVVTGTRADDDPLSQLLASAPGVSELPPGLEAGLGQ